MGKHKNVLLILAFMLCIATSACADEWQNFVDNPDQQQYQSLMRTISSCTTQTCKSALVPDNQRASELFRLVEQGNIYAINITFASRHLFDISDLEDANQVLGKVIVKNPELFLSCAKKYKLSDNAFRSTLISLPLNIVTDRLDLRVKLLQKRIQSVKSVHDPLLITRKTKALTILQEELDSDRRLLEKYGTKGP